MDTQKRAWIYSRIDAPEDMHGVLKEQEKELYDYAGQMGFSIAGISSDLGSGKNMDRPGLARMTAAAGRNEFDALLIRSLSRLGQDAAQVAAILRELERHGTEAFSSLEGKLGAAALSDIQPLGVSESGGHHYA